MHHASRHSWLLLALAALLGLAGCARNETAAVLPNPRACQQADLEQLRKNVTTILERMKYEVEFPPRNPQRVDTLPMISSYPGEFWRTDTGTSYDKAENTINTMRRTVTVFLRPAGEPILEPSPCAADGATVAAASEPSVADPATPGSAAELPTVPPPAAATIVGTPQGPVMVEVIVRRERIDLPTNFNSTNINELYSVFSDRIRVTEQFETQWNAQVRWVDFGRDTDREQYLLDLICR